MQVTRTHEISCGHRVVGHEGKCRFFHGHNYRFELVCRNASGLDSIGRVIDFSAIKSLLCEWLETNWDHRMLLWCDDPMLAAMQSVSAESLVVVPFNPTAENMAKHLATVVAPAQLVGTGVELSTCRIWETTKCMAEYSV